ncbi:putative phage protein (TIGR02216 family) [Aminobacter aganoensis]|uniref:Putative phage protein (TIGR02216 family) n=1 Tax=Aminobacter aganoensis TaxID=83264 RepID=A0A7X0KJT4_9HYPH|nr:putative phage protein (TIGR02216 family) [Aminobacter aganoensis]
MATGFGLLRLSPKDFWAMTPRELERAMSTIATARTGAPGKAQLIELMNRFPDQTESQIG